MQKVFCDICEKEMQPMKIVPKEEASEVLVRFHGRTLDICDACSEKLIKYIFEDMRAPYDIVDGFQKRNMIKEAEESMKSLEREYLRKNW